MRTQYIGRVVGTVVALILCVSIGGLARQVGSSVPVDADDLGGVVTSAKGPEAGAWVIAETKDLPTKYAKIVVTDERGRYLLPDLPKASYSIWVRGYGLVDSPKVTATAGKQLNLTAVVAPNAQAAAQYYPAQYWYSLLQPPPASDFPGTGLKGNGISEQMKSQQQFMGMIKTTACGQCHQMGSKHTREMPKNMGDFENAAEAWDRRVQSGQSGAFMNNYFSQFGRRRAMQMFGDWTNRITRGEVPPAPPRPQGQERNIVVTLWDWATDRAYTHDEASTDKRNPTVNAYGLIYGSEQFASESVHTLDPVRHVASQIPLPVGSAVKEKMEAQWPQDVLLPSPNWGEEILWSARADTHNPMLDHKGRTWFTTILRPSDAQPAYCTSADHPSAKVLPRKNGSRQLAVYDPATKQFTPVNTCGGAGHLQFAEDADHTLWLGTTFFKVRIWDETRDASKADGWTNLVADTNGNGKRDPGYLPLKAPVDPTKDHEIQGGFYGVIPSPVDGSIWGSQNQFPGGVVRMMPGSNPAETGLAEFYGLPLIDAAKPELGYKGYTPRGIDIDRNGVVWTGLSGSGQLASFDRRKCKGPLNGPAMMDAQKVCPEGWTVYPSPGPNFKGVTESGSADMHYFNWVDQHNTSGLGANTPFLTGNNSDSVIAFVNGKWVVYRVPYPMGMFPKGMDGRIDDQKIGWKGRGLWITNGSQGSWHLEGGKGTLGKVAHLQLRPNPLAK